MKKLTIQEIANATHARILAANLEEAQQKTICHVTQDSRQAGEESLFVPLKGKNSDGHDYLKSCMEKGVAIDEAIWKQVCALAAGDMDTTDIASR